MKAQSQMRVVQHKGLLLFGCACLLTLIALHDQYRLVFVRGASMQPTLMTGDLLIVSKHAYHHLPPGRGDLVVARYQNGLIVKRVVGLPGEDVEIKEGVLFVGEMPVSENHPMKTGPVNITKGRLFEGKYAILGDNRALPPGRIVHAIVTKDQMLGKVLFVIHPWGHTCRRGEDESPSLNAKL
jgi:signal peptidase I